VTVTEPNDLKNNIAFQSKTDHPQTGYTVAFFCSCDLDLDPMTLMLEVDVKIPKMCLYTEE